MFVAAKHQWKKSTSEYCQNTGDEAIAACENSIQKGEVIVHVRTIALSRLEPFVVP